MPSEAETAARIHPTAEVSPQAEIGAGTRVWHWVHVREGAVVGRDCVLGQGVYVDAGVHLGNRVKVQNGVSLYRGLTVEDDVFIGPNATFTNDLHPRAFDSDWRISPTTVRRGASVGAAATVVCGVEIGAFALVGAGAVVTRDVPAHALVLGVPARQAGWACVCGTTLSRPGTCPGCGRPVPAPTSEGR